ncbi:MAG: serine--tRNA ligase, partial [Rhodobacteraceae bacterium]|nr:serine--tRNA ligase [Paracoccaceae bacterium]
MHDIKHIRSDPDTFDEALGLRGEPALAAEILEMDRKRRAAIHALEEARSAHRLASEDVARARASNDETAFERLRTSLSEGRDRIRALETAAGQLDDDLQARLAVLPNRPLPDVPFGTSENDNVVLHSWGEPRDFAFSPREHHDLDGVRKGMDFQSAARISGSRFSLLKGAVARLHRA